MKRFKRIFCNLQWILRITRSKPFFDQQNMFCIQCNAMISIIIIATSVLHSGHRDRDILYVRILGMR